MHVLKMCLRRHGKTQMWRAIAKMQRHGWRQRIARRLAEALAELSRLVGQ